MRIHRQGGWMRRGFSLLWEPRILAQVVASTAVVSIRDFFALRKAWPDHLPGSNGDALVVAGLDGCLDSLSEEDAVVWLEMDLKGAVLLAAARTPLKIGGLKTVSRAWEMRERRRLSSGRLVFLGAVAASLDDHCLGMV